MNEDPSDPRQDPRGRPGTWRRAAPGDFETWVLVQNPGDGTVNVNLSFMTSTGPKPAPSEEIPSRSRRTFEVNDDVTDWNVSTRVDANGPVIFEMAIYGSGRTWAHDSIGHAP